MIMGSKWTVLTSDVVRRCCYVKSIALKPSWQIRFLSNLRGLCWANWPCQAKSKSIYPHSFTHYCACFSPPLTSALHARICGMHQITLAQYRTLCGVFLKMTKWLISPYVLNHWEQLLLSRARGNPSFPLLTVSFLTVSGCVSSPVTSSLFTAGALVAALWRIGSPLSFPHVLCISCNGPLRLCAKLWLACIYCLTPTFLQNGPWIGVFFSPWQALVYFYNPTMKFGKNFTDKKINSWARKHTVACFSSAAFLGLVWPAYYQISANFRQMSLYNRNYCY